MLNTNIWAAIGLLAIAVLPLSACALGTLRGSGKLVTETRSVNDFNRVSLSGSGKVIITQGEEESLTIETDDNVIDYIASEVKGGTLTLGTKSGKSVSPTRLRFTLSVKDLVGLKVSGSGDITSASLDTDRLEIGVSGSGDIQIDSLTAKALKIGISGSGHVELAGKSPTQEVTISGSGNLRAADLQCETAKVTISGSGSATVWATESLNARMSGSGSVKYYGSPTVSSKRSGSGKIHGLGDK